MLAWPTYSFHDAGNCKQSGWRNLFLIPLDGGKEAVSRVIEPLPDVTESLRVCRPQHNHLHVHVYNNQITDCELVLNQGINYRGKGEWTVYTLHTCFASTVILEIFAVVNNSRLKETMKSKNFKISLQ